MRRLAILLFMIGMTPIAGFAQQTVGGEYFFNAYVDFGKGIAFSLPSEQTKLEIDVTSAQEGLNVLFLRTKNNLGRWSLTSKTPFYKFSDRSTIETVEMEYFFDSYTDFGKGKKMAVESGKSDYLIDLNGLNPGLHVLYLRTKNNLGQWSQTKITAFYLAEGELSEIVELHYQIVGEGFSTEILRFSDFEPATEVTLDQNQFLANADGLEDGKTYRIKIIAVNEKGQQSITYSTTFLFSATPPLLITSIETSQPSCFNSGDGSIEINVESENLELEFSVDGQIFQSENVFDNLPAGNYTATVRDKENPENKVQEDFKITNPTQLSLSFQNVVNPSCPGDDNGSLSAAAAGGASGYTYRIGTQGSFQNGNTFSNLAAGTYSVTVRDANGCEASSEVTLTPSGQLPPKPTVSIEGVDGISEELSLVSSAATGNQWIKDGEVIPGATGQRIQITEAGAYRVIVSGAGGCTATSDILAITSSPELRTMSISLYPNPAEDKTNIRFGRNANIDRVAIYSATGILLRESREMMSVSNLELDLTGISAGTYVVLVEGIGLVERLRLIKK